MATTSKGGGEALQGQGPAPSAPMGAPCTPRSCAQGTQVGQAQGPMPMNLKSYLKSKGKRGNTINILFIVFKKTGK